jgi:hypothetical protein
MSVSSKLQAITKTEAKKLIRHIVFIQRFKRFTARNVYLLQNA